MTTTRSKVLPTKKGATPTECNRMTNTKVNTSLRSSKKVILRILPKDFEPGEYDVLCGKGKAAYVHAGNEHFRNLVKARAEAYAKTEKKDEKTEIVQELVKQVRELCQKHNGDGGFIRFDKVTRRWYEIGNNAAREKAGQTIREHNIRSNPSRSEANRNKRKAARMGKKKAELQGCKKTNARKKQQQHAAVVVSPSPISKKHIFFRHQAEDTKIVLHEPKGSYTKHLPEYTKEPSDHMLITLDWSDPTPSLSYVTSRDWVVHDDTLTDTILYGDFEIFSVFEVGHLVCGEL